MKLARIHGTGIFAYHLHPFTINVQAKCRQIWLNMPYTWKLWQWNVGLFLVCIRKEELFLVFGISRKKTKRMTFYIDPFYLYQMGFDTIRNMFGSLFWSIKELQLFSESERIFGALESLGPSRSEGIMKFPLLYWRTMVKKRLVRAGIVTGIVLLNTCLVFVNTSLIISSRISEAFIYLHFPKGLFITSFLHHCFSRFHPQKNSSKTRHRIFRKALDPKKKHEALLQIPAIKPVYVLFTICSTWALLSVLTGVTWWPSFKQRFFWGDFQVGGNLYRSTRLRMQPYKVNISYPKHVSYKGLVVGTR